MKEKRHSRLSGLPAVALFREDVDRLVALLTVDDDPPEIASGSYEFDSVPELLAERGSEPDEIEISRHRPGVSVAIQKRPSGSHIWSDGSREAEDLFLRVREDLGRCVQWHNRVPTVWQTWVACWLTATCLLVLRLATASKWPWWVTNSPYSLLVPAVIFGLLRRNRIVLRQRHESPGFWRRKRDDIILLLFGAAIGAVATWFLAK